MFPRTVRRHPRNPDRSQIGGFGNVLCFLIGNAILSYYDACRNVHTDRVFSRLRHLEELADNLKIVRLYGNDAEGWTLLTPEAIKGLERLKRGPR